MSERFWAQSLPQPSLCFSHCLPTWEVSAALPWAPRAGVSSLWRNLPCFSLTLGPPVPIHLPKVALQEDEALQRVKHPGTHPARWAAQDFRSRGRSMSQSLVTHTGVLARHTLSSCLAPRRVTPRPVWRSPLTSCSCTGPAPTPHAGYCHLPPGQPLPSSSSFSSLFSSSAARAGHGLGPSRGAGGEQARQRAP